MRFIIAIAAIDKILNTAMPYTFEPQPFDEEAEELSGISEEELSETDSFGLSEELSDAVGFSLSVSFSDSLIDSDEESLSAGLVSLRV